MYKRAKRKIITLIILILSMSAVFITVNYNNYLLTEKKFNYHKIEQSINEIDKKISTVAMIANDYSNWDDTYEFILNRNDKYIYSNFRDGSYTLEDFKVDFLILSDINNEIIYSKFTKDMQNIDKNIFKKELISNLKKSIKYKAITKINNEPYIVVKLPVHKSDFSGSSNGSLYIGVYVNETYLKAFTKEAMHTQFINNNISKNNLEEINTKNLSKVLLDSEKTNNYFSNKIYIMDESNSSVSLSYSMDIKSEILEEISVMLISFIFMIVLIIISLIYIYFKFKKELLDHEELVNTKVNAKTNQIKVAMLELEKVNGKLYDIAHTDELTKSMNRRNFFMHAQNAFNIAQKDDKSLCVAMVDLDKFKSINDNYGHDIGDEVLIAFAKNVMESIDESDIFGRLGGEEFALVFKDTSLEKAVKKAEKLKSIIEKIEVPVEDKILKFTASFGVSDNNDSKNIDEMLQKADKQLYQAKNEGRNIVRSRLSN